VGWILALGAPIALFAAVAWTYNRLVADRNLVAQAFADVDVQLKRRADLVPALVAAVRAYASHERATLEAVAELRGAVGALASDASARRFRLEGDLGTALQRAVLLQEGYPALKADANFRDLSARLVEVEEQLQHARRFYNGAVMQYSTRCQSFPQLLVARAAGFRAAAYFESDEREGVRVQP